MVTMENFEIVHNLFIQDALGYLRDEKTPTELFRHYADRLSSLLLSHVLTKEDVSAVEIQTPLTKTNQIRLQKKFTIVVIPRAGLAMLPAALQLLPTAEVGFAGVFRDEKTALPHEYYWKMPVIDARSTVLLTDPMLATGGSILSVLHKLVRLKPKEIRIVSIIAAPEGVKAIHAAVPDVKIYTAALDSHLDSHKYIVPGLGDFGDRYFGTTLN